MVMYSNVMSRYLAFKRVVFIFRYRFSGFGLQEQSVDSRCLKYLGRGHCNFERHNFFDLLPSKVLIS